ncbi:cytochrome c3 family protein [Calditrichota bacterium GD2]
MKKLITIFGFLMILSVLGWAQRVEHHASFPLRCSECHYCEKPTYNEPCLKICPDFIREGITVRHSVEDAPTLLIIDTLQNQYAPAVFTHRLHAQMGEMMGGCESCHHHNPPGRVRPCIECHKVERDMKDLSRPSLKGAYHQLCINCHRSWDTDWSKTSDCYFCHAKASKDVTKDKQHLEKLAQKRHPSPEIPDVYVLKSDYEEGPIVTFYHKQHIVAFGMDCKSCHKNNACADCHNPTLKKEKAKLEHDNCLPCHETAIDENCEKCHGTQKKPPFDHAQTGWPLKPFHKRLPCQGCHKDQVEFSALKTDCNSCHKTNWQVGTFNHSVTGIQLDENHVEIDCETCHLNRKFNQRPQCSECHDDKSFPADVPGKVIKD